MEETRVKPPASQLYWRDLLVELSRLSDRAAGLWMKMLCHMAMSPQRGKLVYEDGSPWSDEDILSLASTRDKYTVDAYVELRRKNVFSIDSSGAVYNRRMVRETELSRKRQVAGNKGVIARFGSNLVNQTASKPEANHQANVEQTASKPEANHQANVEQTASKPLARASAHASAVRLTDRLTDENEQNGEQDGRTDGRTPDGSASRRPSAENELAELLTPEVQELLDGYGEKCGIPGTAPAAIVRRCVDAIVETGRYFDVLGVEAIYPAVLAQKLHSAKRPPKSWRWFATVTENAAKEFDL